MDYSNQLNKQLQQAGIRSGIDDRNEKIGKKIRDTELARVPYMLIIGEKEMVRNSAALRIQGKGDQGEFPITELIASIKQAIQNRS